TGAAGCFEETAWIGVVARGCITVDLTGAVAIVAVGGAAVRVVLDIGVAEVSVFEVGENLFGFGAEFDAKVVDQTQDAAFIEAGTQRQFGVSRSAPDERAAGVVADATDDGRADAG